MSNMVKVSKEYNYGVALLRIMLCFLVITCHYWDAIDVNGTERFLSYGRNYAVSVFMIMSFFYSQKFLRKLNKRKVIGRFERLIIPQVSWAIIYWLIYSMIDILFDTKLQDGLEDLVWQIFTGHSPHINATMWYQVDLIVITALFTLCVYCFGEKANKVLWYIGIGAIIIQYTGINNAFSSLRFELKYPLGRLAEMLPLAVLGYFIASKRLLFYVEKYRVLAITSSIIIFALNYRYSFFSEVDGYGYQGVEGILVAVILFICFYLIPLEKANDTIKNGITILSRYTMGIYCMHRLVGTVLSLLINHYNVSFIKENSLVECFIIYIICYACAWVGVMIFKNTKFEILFV